MAGWLRAVRPGVHHWPRPPRAPPEHLL